MLDVRIAGSQALEGLFLVFFPRRGSFIKKYPGFEYSLNYGCQVIFAFQILDFMTLLYLESSTILDFHKVYEICWT